jgi:hypothetical protein
MPPRSLAGATDSAKSITTATERPSAMRTRAYDSTSGNARAGSLGMPFAYSVPKMESYPATADMKSFCISGEASRMPLERS